MKQVTLFAAAAAVSALITTPVLAQNNTGPHAGVHAKTMKSKHMKHHARASRSDEMTYRDRGTGFWPADVVGGAVGTAGAIAVGAVNTAGAIATAPFGGPDYGYGYGDPDYRYRSGYYAAGPNYNPNGPAGYPYGNRHRYGGTYASADYGYIGGYAYNGVAMPQSPSYDARNGFTCRPGTVTRIGNQPVICQ